MSVDSSTIVQQEESTPPPTPPSSAPEVPVSSEPKPSSKSSTSKSKSKSASKSSTSKSSKKEKTEDEKESSAKHWIIGIFVAIGLGLVLFVVYCYEAWKKHWIPFGEFVTIPPPKGVQPTANLDYDQNGDYTDRNARYKAAGYQIVSEEHRQDALAKLSEALYNNCAWFCKGEYLKNEGQLGAILPGEKPNVRKGILKPPGDKTKNGCDCTGSTYVLPPDYSTIS